MSTVPQRHTSNKHLKISAAALSLLILSAITTQIAAWKLTHYIYPGDHWFFGCYPPYQWIIWNIEYGSTPQLKSFFAAIHFSWLAIFALTAYGAMSFNLVKQRRPLKHDSVHGTAHWASEDEIRATGLIPQLGQQGQGVYVGGWTDPNSDLRYLRHNGPEHIAVIAPTRSGKGVSVVVPTLLSWPHSLVVNDQKGELFNLTAGWRQTEGNNIILKFNPVARSGATRFNPLEEIRLGTDHEVGDVQNIATIIVDPDGKGLVDHWAKTSHAFLTGVILHELYKKRLIDETASLADIAAALSDPNTGINVLYTDMLTNNFGPGHTMHRTIASAARDMLNKPDEERGSVLSTAMSYLSLYRDPLIAQNVSRSDFKITDLMNSEKPVTLYLTIRAEDKDRTRPLIRLIINQLMRVLLRPDLQFTDGRPIAPHKHRLLLMLDEFPSYGKLEVVQEALAYIAGYGIKACLIMQDRNQLLNAYGREEAILSNCHIKVAFAPNQIDTAEWLSRMAGQETVVTADFTTSGERTKPMLNHVQHRYHQQGRSLLTADEVMRLRGPTKEQGDLITSPGEMLIFPAGYPPIRGTQSLYFLDPEFVRRSKIPYEPPQEPIKPTKIRGDI